MIFGSDLDPDAVAFARAARYRKFDGMSPERLERWFVKDGDDYCPVVEIRELCVFSVHSLVKDPPFSKLDLISCRNVLFYFGSEVQDRVLQTFHYALRAGGYLFLGLSEGVSRNGGLFSAVDKKQRIFRRDEGKRSLPGFVAGHAPHTAIPSSGSAAPAEDFIARSASRLMEKYSPAYFVIDGNHDILRFSGGEAGLYLEPSSGPASLNLFSILHKDLRSEVRASLQEAFRVQEAVVKDDVTVTIDGENRTVMMIVEPITGSESEPKLAIIGFRERDRPSVLGHASPAATSEIDAERLQIELRTSRTQLQTVRDEMETYIEEHKSATEEYQSVNEELQSANEELETAKEEMQSVNEELQTINIELGNKNEQMTQSNNDLQNLLDSTHIATIFLDDGLRVRNFTPITTDLFPLRYGDRGRLITDFVSHLRYEELREDVLEVLRKLSTVEREVDLRDATATYVVRIRPYRTIKNVIDGVVMTFSDITALKRHETHLGFLMREMAHRTNNLLAVVQAMAMQTGRRSKNYEDFSERFNSRLQGLASSNRLLVHQDWKGAPLDHVVRAQLAPFIDAEPHRLLTEGPAVTLNAEAVQTVGLALHELATNASKYGAFSTPAGTVHVRWELYNDKTEPCIRLVWQERDGPTVKPPKREGFGSIVLNEMTVRTLSAESKLEYLPDGLRWMMQCPTHRAVNMPPASAATKISTA